MSGFTRTRLSFESLERKQMLAGNVLVSQVGGHLVLEGDADPNQIVLTSVADTPGSYVIQGLDGTTLTRAGDPTDTPPATELTVTEVRGNVRISLGADADVVDVHDAVFRHNLAIATGEGADVVRVELPSSAPLTSDATDANVAVRGSLIIRTGADGDVVSVGSASIGGVLAVATDGGDDTVHLGATAAGATLAAAGASDAATLHARFGVDILLGEGTDSAVLRDVSTRAQIVVGGGAGADTIGLHNVSTGILGIRGGVGDAVDDVTLAGVKAGHAGIELGGGADKAAIADSAFSSLAVALGAGNDTLSLHTVKATRALLAGGDGDADELIRGGDNVFTHLAVTGFEIPTDANTPPIVPRRGGPIAKLLGILRR